MYPRRNEAPKAKEANEKYAIECQNSTLRSIRVLCQHVVLEGGLSKTAVIGGVEGGLSLCKNKSMMIEIIFDYFLNFKLIPSEKDPIYRKIFLVLIKSKYEIILKCCINSLKSSCLLFKYYISKS